MERVGEHTLMVNCQRFNDADVKIVVASCCIHQVKFVKVHASASGTISADSRLFAGWVRAKPQTSEAEGGCGRGEGACGGEESVTLPPAFASLTLTSTPTITHFASKTPLTIPNPSIFIKTTNLTGLGHLPPSFSAVLKRDTREKLRMVAHDLHCDEARVQAFSRLVILSRPHVPPCPTPARRRADMCDRES